MLSFLGIDRQDMIELFDSEHTSGVCLLVKMLSVVGVPVIAVILLSSLLLYNAVDTHRLSNAAIDELRAFYQVDQLVTNLQVCTLHTRASRDVSTFRTLIARFISTISTSS